jgi:hypothetical protein
MIDSKSDEIDEFQPCNRTAHVLISLATVAVASASFDDEQMGRQQSVHPEVGVRDILGNMASTPAMFRILFNFTVSEFTERCTIVCPTLDLTARATGEASKGAGGRSKSTSQQRLLNTLLTSSTIIL